MNGPRQKKLPTAKRRRLHPEERRAEMLQAALRVLQDKGTEARVEDVTREAKTAKGTFYLYFPSWEDLLLQVREHIISNYAAGMEERSVQAGSLDWWVAFEQECLYFLDYLSELGQAHQAVFHGPIADRPFDSAASSEGFIAGLLKSGIQAGACREVEIGLAAQLLFSVLHTTADHTARTDDREKSLETMLDLLRKWLKVPGYEPGDEPEPSLNKIKTGNPT